MSIEFNDGYGNTEKRRVGAPYRYELSEIQSEWEQYKARCDSHTVQMVSAGKKVTISKPRVYSLEQFRAQLTMSAEVWKDYRTYAEYSDTIKGIEQQVLGRKAEALADGEGSTTGLIFDLKVNYGWVDKQVIESKVQVTSVEVTLKPAIDGAPIATDEKDVQL